MPADANIAGARYCYRFILICSSSRGPRAGRDEWASSLVWQVLVSAVIKSDARKTRQETGQNQGVECNGYYNSFFQLGIKLLFHLYQQNNVFFKFTNLVI